MTRKTRFTVIRDAVMLGTIFVLLASRVAASDETLPRTIETRIGFGLKFLFKMGFMGEVPAPFSLSADVDFLRFVRVHAEYSYMGSAHYPSFGAGTAIALVGRHSVKEGFQMKLSLLMDIGFFIGIVPIGDGYLEDLKWMMIGPNGGVDFTWWFCKKAGFFVAITGGFMFKAVDMGSEYVRGDVVMAKVIGTPNLIFLLGGVAF